MARAMAASPVSGVSEPMWLPAAWGQRNPSCTSIWGWSSYGGSPKTHGFQCCNGFLRWMIFGRTTIRGNPHINIIAICNKELASRIEQYPLQMDLHVFFYRMIMVQLAMFLDFCIGFQATTSTTCSAPGIWHRELIWLTLSENRAFLNWKDDHHLLH